MTQFMLLNLFNFFNCSTRFPPVKRKHKQSLFVCTIEKAHTLFNSLVSEKRTSELGLVVVDEVHMLGKLNTTY